MVQEILLRMQTYELIICCSDVNRQFTGFSAGLSIFVLECAHHDIFINLEDVDHAA